MIAPTPKLRREQMVTAMRGFPIKELMPEQRRFVGLYRKEYFKVGSSTEPADQPRAEAAITALYASAGLDLPQFEWGPSPRWGAKRGALLEDSVGDSFEYLFRESIRGSFWNSLWDLLDDSVGDRIWNLIEKSLGESLKESLGESLKESLGKSCSDSILASIEDSIQGSHDAYWIAHHLYAADVLNVPYRAKSLQQLRLHDEVARSCGWWWPYEDICVCTDRPKIIEWDNSRPTKLKRVRYRDGFTVVDR